MANAGYFTVTVSADGSFRAKMRAGADRLVFRGQFDAAGSVLITGVGKRKLTIQMQLGSATGDAGLTGQVTDGTWAATLLGDRNTYNPSSNPAPFAGAYSMVAPGTATVQESEVDPGSNESSGTVTVDAGGGVRFAGKLLNKLKATQKTGLSPQGNWPFYVVLPNHQGIAIGWINFAGAVPTVATGTLLWLQPTDPAGGGREFPVEVRVVHRKD
jgi:hypothetical protein